MTTVALQLGIGVEWLRNRVAQAEVDNEKRPGVTTEERRHIAELERENLKPPCGSVARAGTMRFDAESWTSESRTGMRERSGG